MQAGDKRATTAVSSHGGMTDAHILTVTTRRADTSDFTMIHGCLRRATAAIVRAVPTIHAADMRRARAFQRYWQGFTLELEHHHTVEDEIFYPALAARSPEAAAHLERIEADHHRIDELMAEAADSVVAVAERRTHAMLRVGPFEELDALLAGHLDFEDAELVPLFPEHFDHEEYEAMTQGAMKALSPKQALFTVPFIGDQALPEEFARILPTAPAVFRLIHRLTRAGHARLADRALGQDRHDPRFT